MIGFVTSLFSSRVVGGHGAAVCVKRRLVMAPVFAAYSNDSFSEMKDASGRIMGKEESLELDDYREGDRFRDFEADWEEVTVDDDDNELVFEKLDVDEFGMDSEGRDVVERCVSSEMQSSQKSSCEG